MIVSASRRTDIPAFYGEWFLRRLRAGYCKVANPFNQNQHLQVSFKREDVDGFVFWTKNIGPFIRALEEVSGLGFPFLIQYTVNGYPLELEPKVICAKESVAHMESLAARYGPRVVVWRYDTIVMSSLTGSDFHRRNFEELARRLDGVVDEVIVSFLQVYRKTRYNLNAAAAEFGFTWEDPTEENKRDLLADLLEIATAHRMKLSLCSQPELMIEGVQRARCADARRLAKISGRNFKTRPGSSRKTCACFESRDIGGYDTCLHGCAYCYAVRNRRLARERFQRHDPDCDFLCPPRVQF